MTSPVPGWYPDPDGPPGERFWNGSAWTPDTRVLSAGPPPDAPPAYDGFGRPAPSAPPQPFGSPPPYGGDPQYGGDAQHGADPRYGGGPPQYGAGPPPGGGPQYGGRQYAGGPPSTDGPQYGGSPPQYGSGPQYGAGPQYVGGAPFVPPATNPAKDFVTRNALSLATVGVTVVYVLILVFAHIAFLGIVPLILGIRAAARKEPLAVVAVVIGVAALAFGIYEYTLR